MTSSGIEFRRLSKSFGSRVVLTDFTLDVRPGETTALLGYSGTGKSVALKHIVGLLEPDSGEVLVDGLPVPTLSRDALLALRGRVGYVFQFAALLDSMTVFENVALGLKSRGVEPEETRRRVHESLEVVGLPDAGERYPSELSGGMRKRVGIARAIALRPDYILYDEPTTGLDPVTSAIIDQLMLRTKRELGVTGLIVTHDIASAFRVADRVAMLYEGSVRQVGTVDEIRHSDDPVVRQFIEGRP